jgi:endonuclease YncB( thermonuclease family)
MKKFLIALSICCALPVFAQQQKVGVTYNATLTRVIDGDTVAFQALWLPEPLKKELSIRVYGVDTPEKGFRAKCPQEDAKGQAASQFTKKMVEQATTRQVVLMDWDKYGGRVLGDVLLNGQSLRSMLIQQGYAREYYGEAKQSWCD